jgi:hypothetical protein
MAILSAWSLDSRSSAMGVSFLISAYVNDRDARSLSEYRCRAPQLPSGMMFNGV